MTHVFYPNAAGGRQKTYIFTETTGAEPVEEFDVSGTLTSAAAATAVVLLPDARVGPNRKAYLRGGLMRVNGATVWATTANVKIQDTNGTPVDFTTTLVALLTANARVDLSPKANHTLEDAYNLNTGTTLGKGLQVKGDANGTGSDLFVRIWGVIK